ncbi:integrin alpha-5-like [Brevipalpus obovatus]|uniref:integrin alpha-5-like n=1 Tax=Brevipalpus obovatus TaxID=246614 RepID=UPI003D9FAF96
MFELWKTILIMASLWSIVQSFNVDNDHYLVMSVKNASFFSSSISIFKEKKSSQTRFFISSPEGQALSRMGSYSFINKHIYSCIARENSTNCNPISVNFNYDTSSDPSLGSSLQVFNKKLVICSHLKLNDFERNSDYPNGKCFVHKPSPQFEHLRTLAPFGDPNRQVPGREYFFSHAMVGFTNVIDKAEKFMILGAPGFWIMRGAIVLYESGDTEFTNPLIRYPVGLQTRPHSYFGFSVTIGNSFRNRDKIIAVGAPKSDEKGAVWYFMVKDILGSQKVSPIQRAQMIQGENIGAYFGASVLLVDTNGDGLDDLLVGEPNYSNENDRFGDSGRVILYQSDGLSFSRTKILTGSGRSRARFGYSIASVGDLDQDGYQDIAIGAPMESGSGSVYLYNGQGLGLSGTYSQRISIENHANESNIRGFGSTITTSGDVDRNFYPDILIGAPLSGKAFLFRSNPVGSIKMDIKFSKLAIDLNDRSCQDGKSKNSKVPCLNVSFCALLSGKHLMDSYRVRFNLTIDTLFKSELGMQPRAYFQQKGANMPRIVRYMDLKSGKSVCSDEYELLFKGQVIDQLTPMEFILTHEIPKSNSQSFCSTCLFLVDRNSLREQIAFDNGCGDDNKCESEIIISINLYHQNEIIASLIEGFHEIVELKIEVLNLKENAHSTKTLITVEPPLTLQSGAYEMINYNQSAMDVLINNVNPLRNGQSEEFTMKFNLTAIDDHANITFSTNLVTRSQLSATSLIHRKLVIPVHRFANIEIINKPSEPDFFNHSEVRSKSYKTFSMQLTIVKSNYSSVRHTHISLNIPTTLPNGQKFAYRPVIESRSSVSVSCDSNSLNLDPMPEIEVPEARSEALKRNQRSTNTSTSSKKEVDLNCQSLICEQIQCIVGTLGTRKQVLNLRLISAINLDRIEKYFGKNVEMIKYHIETRGKIIDDRITSPLVWTDAQTTDIVLEQWPHKQEIPWWIIMVCSFAALFLLYLIVLILIKIGFFQRKKREQLKDLTYRMSRMIDPNMFPKLDDEEEELSDGMTEIDLKDESELSKEEKEIDK